VFVEVVSALDARPVTIPVEAPPWDLAVHRVQMERVGLEKERPVRPTPRTVAAADLPVELRLRGDLERFPPGQVELAQQVVVRRILDGMRTARVLVLDVRSR
jgi:hypothetical protein